MACMHALEFLVTHISFLLLSSPSQMSLIQPSGDMSAKIREELREPDADAIAKDIVAIREWLDKQPHLPKDMGKRAASS
jgi:hypothetical protein